MHGAVDSSPAGGGIYHVLRESAHEALASAGAGMMVESLFYGLDSYKTHVQSSKNALSKQFGLKEFRGLFRGIVPVVATGTAPSFATFFALYVPLKGALQSIEARVYGSESGSSGSLGVLASSVLCAVPASLVAVPSDVLKKRIVLGLEPDALSAVRNIMRVDGTAGLFVGWRANVIKDVPFAAVKMCFFEGSLSAYVSIKLRASLITDPPLPAGWVRDVSRTTGRLYYANEHTGESTYERPLGNGWEERHSQNTGQKFYHHVPTAVSTYERPADIGSDSLLTTRDELSSRQDQIMERRAQIREGLHSVEVGACGLVSGAGTAVLTCPFDVVNTRLKSLALGETTRRPIVLAPGGRARSPRTLLATARQITEAEGIAALWRGVVPRAIIIGLGSSLFWPIYHELRNKIRGGAAV